MAFFIEFLKKLLAVFQKPVSIQEPEEKPEPPIEEPPEQPKEEKAEKAPEEPKKPVEPVEEMPPPNEGATFEEAHKLALRFEGGYVNDPDDPGGETNRGVTKAVYDKYRTSKNLPIRSVKDMTNEEDAEIYRENYWLKGKCDKLSPNTGIAHFDTCVNTGISQASKILQRTVGAGADGVIGSGTLKMVKTAVTKEGDKAIALRYMERRRDFYRNLAQKKTTLQKFLKGWLHRVDALEKYIIKRN